MLLHSFVNLPAGDQLDQVANCETTARVNREEEARLEEVYNRWNIKERNDRRNSGGTLRQKFNLIEI